MITDRFRLDGAGAVVTGAGRGLGAAIAIALAEAGADVLIAARTAAQLDEVAERVRAAGRKAHPVAVDLADPEAAAALAEAAVEQFGRLDVVVNNVGGAMPKALLDTSPRDLRAAFDFNVANAHALVVAAVPRMLDTAGGGSVINVTSAMGRLTGRGFAAYGTAKAALAHYTRLAAADLAPRVRVNGIAPGAIATSALDIVTNDDGLRTEVERATPLRRIGDPEDVAAAAVFLASAAGGYLTGKILEVDGGITAPNLALPLPDL